MTDCGTCDAYLATRLTVIPAAVLEFSARRSMRPSDLFREFMHGVHARHLSGLSLAVSA